MVTAVPDAVAQLQDSKLRVKPDRSSYLLCKYTFNGTQITKIGPVKSESDLTAAAGTSILASVGGASSNSSTVGGSVTPSSVIINSSSNINIAALAGNFVASGPPSVEILNETNMDTTNSISGSSNTEPNSKRMRTGAESKAGGNSDSGSVSSGSKGPAANKTRGKRSVGDIEEAPIVETVPMAATELLPVVMKMSIVGTLIIHINPEKRIYKFEYIQKVIRLN